MKKISILKNKDVLVYNSISYIVITILALLCLLPFILLISGSFTDEGTIIQSGYSLFPKKFSLEAYRLIFMSPKDLLNAYGVSVFVTVVGTLSGLFLCSMASYVLYRKEFVYRNKFAFFFYFTTLFNGGLISSYILMVRYLHLKNNLLALILPYLLPTFYILVMRSFIRGNVNEALVESAKIDGAGDFKIYYKIVIPMIQPVLASIALFYAIWYWNDWGNAMLYIKDDKLVPLQYMLSRMLNRDMALQAIARMATSSITHVKIPTESFKLAMTVVAIGPIIFVYPFIQRHFIRGLTIGAVKG